VDTTSAKAATELLVRHWKEGSTLAALPQALRPTTRAEAYSAQAHLGGPQPAALIWLEDRGHQRGGAKAHQRGRTDCGAAARRDGLPRG